MAQSLTILIGSPSNDSQKNCIQMISDTPSTGKWVEVSRDKHNLVVCVKTQLWSVSYMQNIIMDKTKQIIDQQNTIRVQQTKMAKDETTINSLQTQMQNLSKNLVPIGF